jgi:hypothetical protein
MERILLIFVFCCMAILGNSQKLHLVFVGNYYSKVDNNLYTISNAREGNLKIINEFKNEIKRNIPSLEIIYYPILGSDIISSVSFFDKIENTLQGLDTECLHRDCSNDIVLFYFSGLGKNYDLYPMIVYKKHDFLPAT